MLLMILVLFIFTFFIVFYNKTENYIQELPEFTFHIVGKIFAEKINIFRHVINVVSSQNELTTLIGQKSTENYFFLKKALIGRGLNDENVIAVYVDTLQIGFLNHENSVSFSNFLSDNKFSEYDAFEVNILIQGGMKVNGISTWNVNLDIPSGKKIFNYEIY